MPAPGYSAYVAPEKYAQIAWVLGLGGKTEDDRARAAVRPRRRAAGRGRRCRARWRTAAWTAQEFEAALPELAKAAFADPSIRTNPRMPLIRELIELLRAGYGKAT